MIALLILCVGVITVIVSCLQIRLYWPEVYVIRGHYREDISNEWSTLGCANNRKDLRLFMSRIDDYSPYFDAIRVWKWCRRNRKYKPIKTIKWN